MNPKVSIIMGIYNCESTLEEAIESIISQTYENWELIMCDDCSSDGTFEVAKKYKDKYPDKIKLIKNEKNITLGPTLNRCIEYVEGKYIARQDGDDFSHRERLEKQVKILEEDNSLAAVGTNMISFDENGEHGVHSLPEKVDTDYYLKRGVIFFHATLLIRTEVMKKLNGYTDKWYAVQAEDYELWSRFLKEGYKGFNLHENLYYVREDRDAYKRKNIKRRINEIKVMVDGIKKLELPINSYFMVIKPIIAAITPNYILMIYHKNKFRIN